MMTTFSQSVGEMAEELGYGKTFGWPAYLRAAREYIVRTGTTNPSPVMIRNLAQAVAERHEEDARAAVALNA